VFASEVEGWLLQQHGGSNPDCRSFYSHKNHKQAQLANQTAGEKGRKQGGVTDLGKGVPDTGLGRGLCIRRKYPGSETNRPLAVGTRRKPELMSEGPGGIKHWHKKITTPCFERENTKAVISRGCPNFSTARWGGGDAIIDSATLRQRSRPIPKKDPQGV